MFGAQRRRSKMHMKQRTGITSLTTTQKNVQNLIVAVHCRKNGKLLRHQAINSCYNTVFFWAVGGLGKGEGERGIKEDWGVGGGGGAFFFWGGDSVNRHEREKHKVERKKEKKKRREPKMLVVREKQENMQKER